MKLNNHTKQLLEDYSKGRLLTFSGIELIVKGSNYNPEAIGRQILEAYYRIKRSRNRREW